MYEHLQRLYAASPHAAEFSKLERLVLGVDAGTLPRAMNVFLSLAEHAFKNGHAPLVSLELDGGGELQGVTEQDANAMVRAFGTTRDYIRSQATGAPPTPNVMRILESRPLITHQESGFQQVLVTSPWHMLRCASEVLLNTIPRMAEERKLDGWTLRGEAFDEYIRQALAFNPACREVHEDAKTGKRPDLVWIGEKYLVLIEAKNRLTPNSARPRLLYGDDSATTILETWRRYLGAVDQAIEFCRRDFDGLLHQPLPPVRVLVVVSLEPYPELLTGFARLARDTHLLHGEAIDALAVMDAEAIEQAMLLGSADDLGRWVEGSWFGLRTDPPELAFSSDKLIPVVRAGASRLLGLELE